MRRENALLREALSIKTELEVLKQSQRKHKSRMKASRSTLHETPTENQAPVYLSKRESVEDWYKDMDISVSSTGSDIRDRLQGSLRQRSNKREGEQLVIAPAAQKPGDVSPIGYFSQTYDESTGPDAPAWVQRNPHLATLFNPSAVAMQLPPLFRTPISSGASSPLVNWTIPPPVLYGLGARR